MINQEFKQYLNNLSKEEREEVQKYLKHLDEQDNEEYQLYLRLAAKYAPKTQTEDVKHKVTHEQVPDVKTPQHTVEPTTPQPNLSGMNAMQAMAAMAENTAQQPKREETKIEGMPTSDRPQKQECQHMYSRDMNQEYPRKCVKCGAPERLY